MKYEFELTMVVRSSVAQKTHPGFRWDTNSIDVVKGSNLTELLGQFLIVLASVHKRVVNDIKTELQVIDDDIPF